MVTKWLVKCGFLKGISGEFSNEGVGFCVYVNDSNLPQSLGATCSFIC